MEKSHVGMAECYFCGEPSTILLDRRLRKSLPKNVGVIDMEPCSECRGWMENGIILISISDDTTPEEMKGPIPNPYRTGRWLVIKDNAQFFTVLDDELRDFALKNRFMFMTDAAWDKVGLPREEK